MHLSRFRIKAATWNVTVSMLATRLFTHTVSSLKAAGLEQEVLPEPSIQPSATSEQVFFGQQ